MCDKEIKKFGKISAKKIVPAHLIRKTRRNQLFTTKGTKKTQENARKRQKTSKSVKKRQKVVL